MRLSSGAVLFLFWIPVAPGDPGVNYLLPNEDPIPGYNGMDPGDVSTEVVIQTKVGKIQGLVVNASGVVTTRFLGIPYARPPIGELRFALPQKHPGWPVSAPLEATEYRFACPQNLGELKSGVKNPVYKSRLDKVITSEDCLYLNMYLPANLSSVQHLNTKSFPVMVYLHGGDFSHGTSIPYEGWRLATHGGVIVVGVEYRLGVLGFLSVPDSAAPGNLGLWDQRVALHWIWDNIREFGGDPESITIFGEGAGGVSAGFHALSRKSRGLFHRAVLQSGSPLSPGSLQRQPIPVATALAKLTQCPTNNYTRMVDCLQKLTLNRLMEMSHQVMLTHNVAWLPVVDGVFLQDDPTSLIMQGRFNPIDYIIGVNKEVGSTHQHLSKTDLTSGIPYSEFEGQLRQAAQNIYFVTKKGGGFEQFYAAVLLEYASFCEKRPQELTQGLMDFYSHSFTIAPSLLAAKHISRSGTNIYLYSFSHSPSDDHFVGEGAELDFIFGESLDSSQAAKALQLALMDSWTNFAKTGNPNPVNDRGINWMKFNEITQWYVDFSLDLSKKAIKNNPWPRVNAFWNDYVPYLLQSQGSTSGATCRGKELCSTLTGGIQSHDHFTTAAMWTLTGTCVILVLVLVALGSLCCLRSSACKCCRRKPQHNNDISQTPIYHQHTPKKNQDSVRRKYNGSIYSGSETRKLRPLPYCDET